jgi:isopropylmalate/homocitrate/citramalate synthase
VVASRPMERSPLLQDVTLREGEQAPRVVFGRNDKILIASKLAELGVDTIQVGFAGDDDKLLAQLRSDLPAANLSVVVVAFRDDWRSAAASAVAAGANELHVLYRGSQAHLDALGLSAKHALLRVEESVTYCRNLTHRVSFCASYATSAEREFLELLYRTAHEAGSTCTIVADSLGIAGPWDMALLVALAVHATDGCEVGVHCHNDFGLALANTLAGLEAGATRADVSVNGYGERAGNCALDELVVALEVLYNQSTRIRLGDLTQLARDVSAFAGVPLGAAKPVTGEDVFTQEHDLHVRLADVSPHLVEPFSPDMVGNRRCVQLGVGTGAYSVARKLRELGLPQLDETATVSLVKMIRDRTRADGTPVDDEKFAAFASRLARGAASNLTHNRADDDAS